ncbi:MAG: TonB-dependent receptor [Pyrinomonadaceae bacterium]|nr:TonB-dependent receptor [Pyrinomonadaceae bacterium]
MRGFFGIFIFLASLGPVFAQQTTETPEPIREQVVVTASRSEARIGDTPASIVTLSKREIETSAAPTIDDMLRQTVGFSIFRRSSSRNANPTTQGVSLRGVGSSGASRSLILFDGVPLNDPFGGWIQWNRVSPIELESIEVLRGGASSLYGDGGLSGAVNMLPQSRLNADVGVFGIDLFAGTQKTLSGSLFLGYRLPRKWFVDGSFSSFQTRGYKPVEESARGPVDSYAGVRSNNFRGRFGRDLGEVGSVFISPTYFGEVRSNGTGLQTNRTHIRQLVFGGDLQKGMAFRWRAYGGTQVFDQVFSAVNAPRTSELPTRVQRVPVQNVGLSASVSKVFADHQLIGGIDLKNVRGSSDEIAYTNGIPTSLVGPGGRQTTVGAFIQDFVRIGSKLVIAGSLRTDHWSNYDAFNATRVLSTGITTVTSFPDREESSFSPKISALFHLNDRFSLYANASRSFRSPTLNELYRSFRVGNVLTLANENLRAERAKNVEGGISFGEKRTFVRADVFWTEIDAPISNVTLNTTPTLITRQRQNSAGTSRSAGIEIEGETSFRYFSVSAGYLYVDAIVKSDLPGAILVGSTSTSGKLNIPQVPRHQFTFQTTYTRSKWTVAIQGRASSSQFDDDQNLFRLEPYAQIDLYVSREIKEGIKVYAAVENVFSSSYSIGKTPIRTVSSPTNLRIGIRWQ